MSASGCSRTDIDHVRLKWTMVETAVDGYPTDNYALVVAGGPWKNTLLKPSRSGWLVDAELRDRLSVLITAALRERQGCIQHTDTVVWHFGRVEEMPNGDMRFNVACGGSHGIRDSVTI